MAQLNINQRQAGDVTILDLDGEVRIGDSSTALRSAIRNLVAGGNQKLLLNLKGVRYIDSSGIGELIANYTTVGRAGGQLKLLNLTEKVQDLLVITKLLTVFDVYDIKDLLQITKLYTVFDVYDNEAEALSSFK